MTTLRTRALSIVAIIAMLVSMIACFVIPATAATSVTDVSAMYADVLANSNDAEGALQAALSALNNDANAAANINAHKEALAAAAAKVTLNANVVPRCAYAEAYLAAGYVGKSFNISKAEDWLAMMEAADLWEGETYFDGYIFHLTNDIDFSGAGTIAPMGKGKWFAGTLDGHGYGFDNVTLVASDPTSEGYTADDYPGLFRRMGNCVVKDFGINSGSFTMASGNSGTAISAFGYYKTKQPKLTRVWFGADLVGRTGGGISVLGHECQDSGAVFNGFYFYGNTTSSGSIVFTGSNSRGNVYFNSITAPKNVGSTDCMIRAYRGDLLVSGSTAVYDKVFNLYGVGYTQAYGYRDAGITSSIIEEDNARLLASSTLEAAWKINSNQNEDDAIEDIYYTMNAKGDIRFGTKENCIVRVLVRGEDIAEQVMYTVPGTVIDLTKEFEFYTGKGTTVVGNNGAVQISDYKFTLPSSDVIVDVTYSPKAQLVVYKDKVEALLEKYELLDAELVYDPEALETFRTEAKKAIENDDLDMLKMLVEMEAELDLGMVNQYPQYPSVKDFDKYQELNVDKNWIIKTASDWLGLVERSIEKGEDYSGHTFHLANDIDFGGIAMAPLCYGGVFSGTIDGHNYSFKNVCIKATELSASNPIGLISKAGGATIKNWGLASGSIDASGTGGNVYCGAFIGTLEAGGVNVTRCWNGATITADQTANSDSSASALVGIPGQNHFLVNGFYNVGTLNGNLLATGENYLGVIHGGKHGNYAYVGTFNAVNLGTYNTEGAVVTQSTWGRINASVSGPNFNCWAIQMPEVVYYGTPSSAFNVDINPATAEQYASGELAYLMNVNTGSAVGYQGSNNNYKGETIPPVYFTMKDGAIAFAKEDGSDQVRKITLTNAGAEMAAIYAAAGTTVSLNVKGVISYDSIKVGNKSVLVNNNTALQLANEDVTIEVSMDTSADLAEKLVFVQGLLDKYEGKIDASVLANADEFNAWKAAAQAAIQNKDLAGLNKAIKNEPALVLKDDFIPAYSEKALFASYNLANKWAISTADDWFAMIDASASETFEGYSFYLTNDIDFNNVEMAPLNDNANVPFKGALYGQGYEFKNVNVLYSGSANQSTGLIGKIGACIIDNFGVDSGIIESKGSNYQVASLFGDANGAAKISRVWCGATLKCTTYHGTTTGFISACQDTAATLNGAYFYGTLIATTNTGSVYIPYDKLVFTGENSRGTYVYNSIANPTSSDGVDGVAKYNAAGQYKNGDIQNTYAVGSYNFFHNNTVAVNNTTAPNCGFVDSAIEAAWKINNLQENSAVAEKIYYSLNANGDIRFGTAETAIRKVIVMDGDKVLDTKYVNPGKISLEYEGVTFYELASGEKSEINGFELILGAEDVVVNAVRCSHEGADVEYNGDGTHTVKSCPNCNYTGTEPCYLEGTPVPNDDLVINGVKFTATHRYECACGNYRDEACTGKPTVNEIDCTQDAYFVFSCCSRENATIVGQKQKKHNFGSDWTADGDKEYVTCSRCTVKNYRTIGKITVAAQGTILAGGTAEVLVTLPIAMTQATFALSSSPNLVVTNVEGEGFSWVEGSDQVTLTAPAAAGASFKVTLKADSIEMIEDGFINVSLSNAQNGDVAITGVSTDVTVRFERMPGDANGDGQISLMDAVLLLMHLVKDSGTSVFVNTANIDMDGDNDVSIGDAMLIVRLWLKTSKN